MNGNWLLSIGGFLAFLAICDSFRGVRPGAHTVILYGTLALAIGFGIAGEIINFLERVRRRNELTLPDQLDASDDAASRPAWMGDPAGNRRRLTIIMIVFAVFAVAGLGFLLIELAQGHLE